MKRIGFLFAAMLGIALCAAPAVAQSVTGAGAGVFSGGATLNGIPLSGLELGKGVIIAYDGTAKGQFHALLLGTSLLGQPQHIVVEGEVSNGFVNADGSTSFSGSAKVNMGDATPPLLGLPFSVTATTGGVLLTIGTTTLPAATLLEGSITIE